MHTGVSPLAFVLMSVADENEFREDQEAYNRAKSLTPGMTRASKRKYPSITKTLRELVELLRRYISTSYCLWHIVSILYRW